MKKIKSLRNDLSDSEISDDDTDAKIKNVPYFNLFQSSLDKKTLINFANTAEYLAKMKLCHFDFQYQIEVDGKNKVNLKNKVTGTLQYVNSLLSDKMKDFLYNEKEVKIGNLDGLFRNRFERKLEALRADELEQYLFKRLKSARLGRKHTTKSKESLLFQSKLDIKDLSIDETDLSSIFTSRRGQLRISQKLIDQSVSKALTKTLKLKKSKSVIEPIKKENQKVSKYIFNNKFRSKKGLLSKKFDDEITFQKDVLKLKKYEQTPFADLVLTNVPLELQAKQLYDRLNLRNQYEKEEINRMKSMINAKKRRSALNTATLVKEESPWRKSKTVTREVSEVNIVDHEEEVKYVNQKNASELARLEKELRALQVKENRLKGKVDKEKVLEKRSQRSKMNTLKDMDHFLKY